MSPAVQTTVNSHQCEHVTFFLGVPFLSALLTETVETLLGTEVGLSVYAGSESGHDCRKTRIWKNNLEIDDSGTNENIY